MDPTPEERAAIVSVDSLLDWADVTGDSRAALLQLVGMAGTDPLRVFAAVPPTQLEPALGLLQIGAGATPPQLALTAKINNAHRVARVLCGVERSLEEQAAAAAAAAAAQAAAAQAQPPPQTAGATAVRLEHVIDQALTAEIPALSDTDIQLGYSEYKRRMGAMPGEGEEPTSDQLTAVHHLLKSGVPPYADFAVFGPHQLRLRRRLKFSGMTIARDGHLQSVELHGPPSVEERLACYRVLTVCLIMLKAVTPARLERYAQMIVEFATRYSRTVWTIVYQADVRMRLEHMQSLRRDALERIASDPTGSAAQGLDQSTLWECVWGWAVENSDRFWSKQLVEPSVLVLSHAAQLGAMVHGDAQVAGGPHQQAATAPARASLPGVPPAPPARHPAAAPRRERRPKEHNCTANGHMATNRKGRKLCQKFQTGECATLPGGIACSANPDFVHQCAVCLSPGHGASTCTRQGARDPNAKGKGGKRGGRSRPGTPY